MTLEENETSTYRPSGIIVLFMCKLQTDKYTTEYTWGQKEANILKTCKNNIITGHSHHFGSSGNYYSYGNRANYGMINNSSVTQYVSKKYSNKERTLKAATNAAILDDRASEEMKNGIMALTTIIPNLKEYIAPTLNVIYDIQSTIGDIHMKKTTVSDYGMWQLAVGETCQTSNLHVEDDCTYTIICTPSQDYSAISQSEYNFLFEIKKGVTIGIKLERGVTLLYSGKYLMHRQMHNESIQGESNIFFNFASYGNERLYNHLKASIKRVYK